MNIVYNGRHTFTAGLEFCLAIVISSVICDTDCEMLKIYYTLLTFKYKL